MDAVLRLRNANHSIMPTRERRIRARKPPLETSAKAALAIWSWRIGVLVFSAHILSYCEDMFTYLPYLCACVKAASSKNGRILDRCQNRRKRSVDVVPANRHDDVIHEIAIGSENLVEIAVSPVQFFGDLPPVPAGLPEHSQLGKPHQTIRCAETLRKGLHPSRVLSQQIAQVRRRSLSCCNGQEHFFFRYCEGCSLRRTSPLAEPTLLWPTIRPFRFSWRHLRWSAPYRFSAVQNQQATPSPAYSRVPIPTHLSPAALSQQKGICCNPHPAIPRRN